MNKKSKVMSPAEFAEKMNRIADRGDEEARHIEADYLMCEVLEALGYGNGTETFMEMERWYS